jgi:hypothetical protein
LFPWVGVRMGTGLVFGVIQIFSKTGRIEEGDALKQRSRVNG